MYGISYSGGHNRTHGQIERAERIDSFEAGKVEGRGLLIAYRGTNALSLQCEHYQEPDRETVELFYLGSPWSVTLELTRTPSGFGGSCTFWLCPCCDRRARFLYFKGKGFVCRSCAKLNYAVQQRTKDSVNHAYDGIRLAREKLHWRPLIDVKPLDFPYMTPDRPKGMHETTYRRHLARYRRYQEKYRRDSLRQMLAILRR